MTAPIRALDPSRGLSQYLRDEWGASKGFTAGAVHGFAQTADGFLWIAADKGLVRFDGASFASVVPPDGPQSGGPTVLGVATSGDALLTRLRGSSLLAYRDGVFQDLLASFRLQGIVGAMAPGRGGSVLIAAHSMGVLRYANGTLVTIVDRTAMPKVREQSEADALVTSIAENDNGIWIGTRDAGMFRFTAGSMGRVGGLLRDTKINCLLAVGPDELWVGTDDGVVRYTPSSMVRTRLPADLGVVPALALLRDRDANIWVAAGARGLVRINASGVEWLRDWDPRSRGIATALFEDRDRNLWVGTSRGIQRLRDGVFAAHSAFPGLASDRVGPVHISGDGRPWFAPTEGGLYWLENQRAQQLRIVGLEDDVVYSLDGRGPVVWVGRQYGGLTRIEMTPQGPAATTYTERDGLAQDSVYVVHDPGDGTVWAGTLSGGVSQLRGGRFETFTTRQGLVSNAVRTITSTSDGTTWFGTPDGISRFSKGQWRAYRTTEGLPANDVAVLVVDRDANLWAGTTSGLAVLRPSEARFRPIAGLREPVVALLEDAEGALWCATAGRLVRVPRASLLNDTTAGLHEYDAADGLVSQEGVKRQRTLTADARGRVWYASAGGLSVADPSRLSGDSQPALLHVASVTADDVEHPATTQLALPSGARRIAIAFSAVNLAVPERIRYRYRLDGFDPDWSQPSVERAAVYTNLGPGSYTFRVVAFDGSGQWTSPEQTLTFAVLPAFWQTTSFRVVALALIGGLVWGGYRFRLMQVKQQLNLRFDERLSERTRIAQELHDTLLQGVISVSMHLHVAATHVPEDLPARGKLAFVRQLLDRVIEDGRDAIRGLRAPGSSVDDLQHALSAAARELGVGEGTHLRVVVEGQPQPLHPLIRDEVYRISREALSNAARHAQARTVEVTVAYRPEALTVSVLDDGVGIDDEHVLQAGRDGHWGLAGMRERARALGAQLKVSSRPQAGTAIELSIPARVAFRRDVPHQRRRFGSWKMRFRRPS